MEYYPTIEKKKIFNNINGPWGTMLNEISQRKTNIV